jgi:anti-sigma regulatory factor (Ser/Thr protein kinase)
LDEQLETPLPATALAGVDAREFLRAALNTWSLDGFGAVTELLATELVENAVLHAEGSLTLRVAADGERIRVEVDDSDSGEPVFRISTAAREVAGASSLSMPSRLRGSERHDQGGKTVWFETDIATATNCLHGAH